MKLGLFAVLLLLCSCAGLRAGPDAPVVAEIPYGDNAPAASRHALGDTTLYLESYGQGEPLLLIHGNGQRIAAMRAQIDHFSPRYRVIAVDSRGHGHSPSGDGRLSYEKIADDFAQLLQALDLGPVHVLGWSDGGIVGLLLAIEHPELVNKLAIMGANLNPQAAADWTPALLASWRAQVDERIAAGDTSRDWSLVLQRLDLLEFQPQIEPRALRRIRAPTLVMAGDKDVIRNSHTLEIFEQLPKAHLCIFPGATHMIPERQPALFNATVERFLVQPYTRPTTQALFEGTAE